MLPWLQLTPGGHECVCIVWDIIEKCVHCSSMQCCISCIQLQCHTVKSLWSAPRPHRYNSLPFYKSLLKGCVFDPQRMAAFHFCSPHVWLNISIWDESVTSFLALPHCLFGWFSIVHTSGRMAKPETKIAYCHNNPCACYEVSSMVWHCCCIFQVTVLNHFSIMYDRILRLFAFH